MRKKLTVWLLAAALLAAALAPAAMAAPEEDCPSAAYPDLDPVAWYHADMDYAVAAGLLAGFEDGLMRPDAPVTRAQLWTVLARLDGADLTGGDIWYEKAAAWAAARDLGDGTDPDGPVRREEAVLALWLYDGAFMSDGVMPFTDAAELSPGALQAVIWCAEQGIIKGYEGGAFRPQSPLTRAELAALLHRFLER